MYVCSSIATLTPLTATGIRLVGRSVDRSIGVPAADCCAASVHITKSSVQFERLQLALLADIWYTKRQIKLNKKPPNK